MNHQPSLVIRPGFLQPPAMPTPPVAVRLTSTPVARARPACLWLVLSVLSAAPLGAAARTVDAWIARTPGPPAWEAALRSGALAPLDTDALPPRPELPDPLRRADGSEVADPVAWAAQRDDLRKLLQHYVVGTFPPAPRTTRSVESSTERDGAGSRSTFVLEFSPRFDARLRVEVLTPPGTGPFPVLLLPATHRDWAVLAVSRGYLACVYAAGDGDDDTRTFAGLHPASDWTLLARRAWATARCIDYLMTRKDVDPARITAAGAGRQAAVALVAAAFDPRIAVVIAADPGPGGVAPFRLTTEADGGRGIEGVTRTEPDWLHRRLRFFAGQEARLPVDQHHLLACIAPRPVLVSLAGRQAADPVWAVEASLAAARPVYALHRQETALQLALRTGGPGWTRTEIQDVFDWLDGQLGRGTRMPDTPASAPTYAAWQRLSRERIDPARFPLPTVTAVLGSDARRPLRTRADWLEQRKTVLSRVGWVLGDLPPFPEARATAPVEAARAPAAATALGERATLSFGNGVTGDLVRPLGATAAQPVPAVIWLPPGPRPEGPWGAGDDAGPPATWLEGGFAVVSFDSVGSGGRSREADRYYQRHPHGSLLGQALQDLRAAVTVLQQQKAIDGRRIYLLGSGTGGFIALHAAALDERIAGVVCVNGLTPLRVDTTDRALGGIARWSLRYPWLPRLGAFVGAEPRIPYDLDEVLALIAPRPVTVVRSRHDLGTSGDDVRAAVQRAAPVFALYGPTTALRLFEVDDYHRFSPAVAREAYRALKTLEASAKPSP
ncbi:MAG: prolyl oligopeptidase family serine peptidase [Opitutaceae bacterium]|nr:prolyl oligopeptidase family serine peptidase [Opitutaceae bacterium]